MWPPLPIPLKLWLGAEKDLPPEKDRLLGAENDLPPLDLENDLPGLEKDLLPNDRPELEKDEP